MKKQNNKGFTLIELLVVVAIIGILAAVGVVAYSGYTSSAKKAGTKSNHASVVKYVAAELKKCELGDTGVMKGKDGKLKLTCSERKVADKVADGAVAALAEFKNTYGTVNSLTTAVRKGAKFATSSACTTSTEGVTRVTNTTSAVTVSSCPGTGEDPLNDEFIIE